MNINSRVENGRLIITADNETRRELAESFRKSYQHGESDLAEYGGMNGANGGLSFLPAYLLPEAMTEMPLLADWSMNDDGGISVYGTVYGFPNYCIDDPWADLYGKGRVVFEAVADYGELGAKMPRWDSAEARAINAEAFDKCLQDWKPIYPPAS